MAEETFNEELMDAAFERDLRLARSRNAATEQALSNPQGEEDVQKLRKLVANKDREVSFVLIAVLAFIGSTLGAIPFIGWAISLCTSFLISAICFTFEGHPKIKAQIVTWAAAAINSVLAVFALDALPEQMVLAILIYIIVQVDGRKAEHRLEEMGVDPNE